MMSETVSNSKGAKCSVAAKRAWASRTAKERKAIGKKISSSMKRYFASPKGKKRQEKQGREHSKRMKSGLFQKTGLAKLSPESVAKRERSKSKTMRRRYKSDPNYGAKRIASSLTGRPMSLPEEKVRDILCLLDLPYRYVGDGKLMIGRFCPDFCREDAKAVIDVFSYTHMTKNGKMKAFDKRRLAFIRRQGFSVLVVWQKDLDHIGKVADRIKRFDERVLSKLFKLTTKDSGPPAAHIGEARPTRVEGNPEGSRSRDET